MKKIFLIAILAVSLLTVNFSAKSQGASIVRMTQVLSSASAPIYLDTVTNTATVVLTSPQILASKNTIGIQINVTKISGTVGGTISLLGSIDGVNYKALNTTESQTALATITATDATNTYTYRLTSNHYLYYRVSWTGTGTMAASFNAYLLSR